MVRTRSEIAALGERVEADLNHAIGNGAPLVIVKAPPGSGKTFLLLRGVEHAANLGLRIAIGGQTNSQVDDICSRIASDYPDLSVSRFAAAGSAPTVFGSNVHWVTDKKKLPVGPAIVAGTIAKWSLTADLEPFDIMFVDEAWQMSWSDFMLCGQITDRFVLIGDPGQIPPIVSIPVERWETSPRAPHQAAPQIILDDPGIPELLLELPASRRLPHDSVGFIRPFYDFSFDAWAKPDERYVGVAAGRDGGHVSDAALDLLSSGSVVALTAPTPSDGPPLELDEEIARLAAATAARLVERGGVVVDDDDGVEHALQPEDIGLAATHRVVNHAMGQALPSDLRDRVVVDTPERWQGLERKVMIIVHPLSGVTVPSAFDLETGRLCVMTSRHRSGLVVVSRDHVQETLETHIPFAEQAVGRPDITGRGHEANLGFWETMNAENRVVQAK